MDFKIKTSTQRRRETEAAFSMGIEEEYFLCDAVSLDLAMRTPEELFQHRHAQTGASVNYEMLQAQIEVATRPHKSVRCARDELINLRGTASDAAAKHGLKIIASGTHPTGDWREAIHTPKERYHELMAGLQMVGQRNLLCGMHVHVELPDADSRIDVMARMIPYLPLLVALSTSSPFWRGQCSGLKGYRLTAYDELPRTGMPELFRSAGDYDAYVSALVCSGAIPDASHVWWSVRPSHKYPTLELRAPDCCTRIDDALAIASLYRALVRHLFRYPQVNAELDNVDRAIAVENKWRAQRYGVEGSFASAIGAITVSDMLNQVIEQISADAEGLGCLDAVEHCRSIISLGTSADMQLRLFFNQEGEKSSFNPVLRWIADTTVCG
ncbi:MAG: carboxylate-amine ligase [Xanthobacteraceae bacterium]